MRKNTIDIKVEYRPLNTYKNVVVLNGSNRQNYNANNRHFEPDRRIDPYVIRVECGVNDPHSLVSGLVNAQLTDVVWKLSSNGSYNVIETTNKEFQIGIGADKGQLKILKNVSDLEPVTILFTARYIEPKTKRVCNFQESFTLLTLAVAQSPVLLETFAPVGYNLIPTENNQGLLTVANLVQGLDKLPAAYYWYKGATELTDVNGYLGSTTEKLFVPASAISKVGDIVRVEVGDCSDYFNQLVEQKVEADPQVIEWRRLYENESENLLSNASHFDVLTEWPYDWSINIPSGDLSGLYVANDILTYTYDNIPFWNFIQKKINVLFKKNKRYALMIDLKAENAEKTIIRISHSNGTNLVFEELVDISGSYVNKYFVFSINDEIVDVSELYVQVSGGTNKKGIINVKSLVISEFEELRDWSPSRLDLQNILKEKREYYAQQTSFPIGYRPAVKPQKLYKGDFMLMKQFPEYQEELLYPDRVSPEATSVRVEMVLNTNTGTIPQPERFFSVGWLKQADNSFKYKGFKVNITMADILALNAAGKELDYEIREDLTLKL